MCIAIYKKAGAEVLKKKVYKRCFRANPDGAGFAWWDGYESTWHARKGFMTFKAFWKAFNRLDFLKDTDVICHFRVGTSGNRKGADCTHPFPVTLELAEMRELEFSNKQIVFHNGVIGMGVGINSDSMLGVQEYIAPLLPHIDEPGIEDILEECLMTGKCRWLITDDDKINFYGTWVEDKDYPGYSFSNRCYEEPKVTVVANAIYSHMEESYNRNYAYNTIAPHRMYKVGKLKDFQTVAGLWSWALWEVNRYSIRPEPREEKSKSVSNIIKESHEKIVTPNKEVLSFINHPASVMGLLDKDGNIMWDDGYSSVEDLLSCPSCGGEDLITVDGNMGCRQCGCIFNGDSGETVSYNKYLMLDKDGKAYCDACLCHMPSSKWGECVKCGNIIDPTKMEKKIVAQQEAREEAV
jgi:hypothetical protein